MLDVVEGPNLDEFTSNDLSRVSNPESKYMLSEKEGIFQNPSDQLIASIRQYLYAENLEKYWLGTGKQALEKSLQKTLTSDNFKTPEEKHILLANKLSKNFIEYLNFRLEKELKTLQQLPLEIEIKIKFASGKDKYDKLRKSDKIVSTAIYDADKAILVSLARIIGLPVYSELAKNKSNYIKLVRT